MSAHSGMEATRIEEAALFCGRILATHIKEAKQFKGTSCFKFPSSAASCSKFPSCAANPPSLDKTIDWAVSHGRNSSVGGEGENAESYLKRRCGMEQGSLLAASAATSCDPNMLLSESLPNSG
jgi:hypothetical protein